MADAYPSARRYAPIGSPDHEHQPPESEYLSLYIPTRFYSRYKITAFFANMQILFQKYLFLGRLIGSKVAFCKSKSGHPSKHYYAIHITSK